MPRGTHPSVAILLAASVLLCAVGIPILLSIDTARAAPDAAEAILPPPLPWAGESRALMVPEDHPWITPAERSGLSRTPRYEETVAWLRRLVDAAPELAMLSLGTSAEGREIWMVIASRERAFSAAALRRSGKPTLLAQAGIHAGEIDGKDAGLMLLRDMTVRGTKGDLLDGANFLFVPILSVDGHERFSRFNRLNQRGPEEMGWRANARRQNLNRDYTKLDTLEMRAMVAALDSYDPDLYLDLHVTDGIDYQYDITFGYTGPHGHSPSIVAWLDRHLAPALKRDLRAMGHVPGPLIFARDRNDLGRGLIEYTAAPRFSHGYGDLRHLPIVLVENHSLKSYEQRVLGTRVLLESCLRVLARHGAELRRAIAADRGSRRAEVPLTWTVSEKAVEMRDFLMVDVRTTPSSISGGTRQEWTGEPVTRKLPYTVFSEPAVVVTRPLAYWIPAAWGDVIERMRIHGIEMERIGAPREVDVEVYRIEDAELAEEPYEGHVQVTGTPRPERRRQLYAPGSVRVPTDQPLGDLAIHLLEPASPDSFFQWGFFLETMQRVEYFEAYVMDPMAERMLSEDESLAEEFKKKLRDDPEFASDPRARLQWFYKRTPFYDRDHHIYPVGRE